MTRYKKLDDSNQSHIMTLRILLVIMTLALAFSLEGWRSSPENIRVDIPPDLRVGSTQKVGERYPSSVYAFGYYIFQQLNNWPTNGTKDYKERIASLACYITPKFRGTLERDYEKRGKLNELNRQRAIQEIPGHGYEPKRVYIESPERWVAFYDISVKETFRSETIKDIFVRYPLKITSYSADPECNPWGLALDGYYRKPNRLEDDLMNKQDLNELVSN